MKDGVKAETLLKNLGNLQQRASKADIRILSSAPHNAVLLKVDAQRTDEYITLLKKDSNVIHVQKNKTIHYRRTPNDPLFNDQWQYNNLVQIGNDLNILSAWDITTGGVTALGDTIVVAVLEDGIGRHDDIVDNLWINRQEIPGDKIDNDGNGYVDDYYGWNVVSKDDNVGIDDRHGTQVAGIIGAVGNNNKGVSGINWAVKLLPIVTGDIDEANAIAAYSYAFVQRKLYNTSNGKKGAFIVATNSSWGIDRGDPNESPIWCSFYDSLGTVGILSCAATANSNIDVDVEGDMPTACPSDFLITVTNVGRTDNKITSSGYGRKSIDLGAYGENVYNISSSNRYSNFTGTSASTPQVSGAIALAYSVPCPQLIQLAKSNPSEAARVLKQAILASTKANTSLNSITRAQGRLDIGKLVNVVNNWCSTCAAPQINDVYSNNVEGKFSIALPNLVQGIQIDLRLRPIGSDNWLEYQNINSQTQIEGLSLCTEYEYQLKTSCGTEVLSDYRYSRFLTSFGCCPYPKLLNAAFSKGIMEINLEAQDLIDVSLLEYKEKDATNWIEIEGNYNFEIGNLPDCSFFEYRLSHSCLNGRSLSPITNQFNFNTECGLCTDEAYCDDFNINNKQEWIETVSIGENLWETGQDFGGHGKYLGYKIPVLDKNKYYKLEIIPGFSNQTYQENFKLYIDLNNDFEFSSNELLYNSNGRKPFVKDSIIIPTATIPGIKRMRVVMNFEDRPVVCNNTQDYGEIEEYCIEVSALVSSEEVKNAVAISIENTLFQNFINFNLPGGKNRNFGIQMFDVQGKSVLSRNFNSYGQETYSLDGLEILHSGLYIVSIRDGESGQHSNFKVIKPE